VVESKLRDDGTLVVVFRLQDNGAETACVVGDFNEWSETADPMDRVEDGFLKELVLVPGRVYQFRYLLDGGRWENDWAADSYAPNEFGGDNSVIDLTDPASETMQSVGDDVSQPDPVAAPITSAVDEDAVAFLERQHEEIRSLFREVEASSPGGRAEPFQCLVRLLAVHETAEEEVIHPAVRGIDGGNSIVEERLAEESAAKEMLADLEKLGVDDPGFMMALDELRIAVETHATREETDEFPLVEAGGDDAALAAMARQLRLAEAVAPTHPHPHGPESAIGNMVVGPFVAIADRVRDIIARR
jgi:hypothetical protein